MTFLPVRGPTRTAAQSSGSIPLRDPAAALPLRLAYWAVLALTTVFSVVWLAIGAVVALAARFGALRGALEASAAAGNPWAAGVVASVPRAEPFGQAVLDYGFSIVGLVLAVVLLVRAHGSWVARLLALAMVGSAGAFNLQAHGATVVVERAVGVAIGQAHQVQLHGIACAAYIMALLLFPTGRWRLEPGAGPAGAGNLLVALPGVATLLVVGVGTALLPHTISCILFFGFAVPLVGLAALQRRKTRGGTADIRAQSRLLFTALVGASGTIVVLALITFLLIFLRQPGLTLVDPTAAGAADQPTALLFWFSRLAAVAIAAAALVASRRGGLWTAERLFSRGLASVLVVAVIGGGWVVVRAVVDRLYGVPTAWASIVATVTCSLGFLPLYLRVESLVERLLYGSRPTPYRVLADVAALSGSQAGGPNLAAVAEAIGKALGAASCQLTVLRPGLRDRTYGWDVDSGTREWTGPAEAADEQLLLPIRQGTEQIGTIAVDRGAVAGLQNERRHLLEDVTDSLGAILQASRLSIELERQLRAALAHAEEIAESRRTAVAEMDSERRTIERDLHDGAQHHLVTLRLALGLVEHEVAGGKLQSARERLGTLGEQLSTAEAVLAKTATGVSSIVLSEQGLVAALRADLSGAQPPVTVEAARVETLRFGPDVETAVYFCCLESINNARKHAGGAPVAVRLDLEGRELRFEVRDSGPGFDTSVAGPGRGLRNLNSRITTVGGTVDIESAPGAGTRVYGRVHLKEAPRPVEIPNTPIELPKRTSTASRKVPASTTTDRIPVPGPLGPRPLPEPTPPLPGPTPEPLGPTPGPEPVRPDPEPPGPTPDPLQPTPEPEPPRPDPEPLGPTPGPEPLGPTPGPEPLGPTPEPEPLGPTPGPEPPGPTPEPEPLVPGPDPDLPTPQPGSTPRPDSVRPAPTAPTVPVLRTSNPAPDPPTTPFSNGQVDGNGQLDEVAPDVGSTLLRDVREVVRSALQHCAVPGDRADLDRLWARVAAPLRVGVTGPPGSGASTLAAALSPLVPPGVVLLDLSDPAGPGEPVDAYLRLLRAGEDWPVPPGGGRAPVLGVLARADELCDGRPEGWDTAVVAAAELQRRRPAPGQLVVPVVAGAALAARGLTGDGLAALRELAELPDDPDDGPLGPFGTRVAVELLREGADGAGLAAELVRLTGVARIAELLHGQFTRRAQALRARTAMLELEALVREAPDTAEPVLYRLEQLHAGTHELAEMELCDALADGSLLFMGTDREAAERLLGLTDGRLTARLGLPDDASGEEVRAAVTQELTHWRRQAGHPTAPSSVRRASEILARTCESLLARTLDAEPSLARSRRG